MMQRESRMTQPLHQCMTKAIVAEGDRSPPSLRWIFARRGTLKVFPDRLECGNWVVPYDEVEESMLSAGEGFLVSGFVLRVRTSDRTYQFGLNRSRFWEGDLPFRVRREAPSPSLVWIHRAVRVAGILGIAYLVWSNSQ